jgi:ribosome-associated protein
VRFDIAASRALGPRQRSRLLEKLGPVVRAVASDRRSQTQNRALALERLRDRIANALHVEAPRVATRPTVASRRRRVDEKRRQAERKRERRRPLRNGDD